MSEATVPVAAELTEDAPRAVPSKPGSSQSKLRLRTLIALPLALGITCGVHLVVARKEPAPETLSFSVFLGLVFVLALLATGLQLASWRLRKWVAHFFPILSAASLSVSCWELITTGFRWLPLPYFPSPAAVLQSLINDRKPLFDSTWHSLALLVAGYAIGTAVALVAGVCIGWSGRARYWGMPLLKLVGPIPATAWVPLAMVLSPSGICSAIGLIALSVWFPVTMLTVSGIANTKASYLDVARTLGASERYLIFHVAVPAAMPSIFIGLFMGLGTSFLTLIVAETVGVKSGLGYYLSWAQGWAEYGKVYAALIIMAAFFSTIMTLLFKLRDRVLVWQKGTIKW